FVSEEAWCGEFVLSNYPEIITPTYPDGKDATGYLIDSSDPTSSMLYDACASKDLNGNYIRFDGLTPAATEEYGIKLVDSNGKVYYATDMAIAKDTAAPFWLSYNIAAAKYFMEQGVDFFWIDNWNGWDAISSCPIKIAFGDWTVAGFPDYLKAHPELGVSDPDDFSIIEYVKAKALEISPNCNVTNMDDPVWKSGKWIDDAIWMAYLSYKSDLCAEYAKNLYNGIKQAAADLGLDPDSIGIGGNDFPYLTFGTFESDALDMIHTEYTNYFNIGSGSTASGDPPYGYSGHTYNLISSMARSNNAVVWYYHSGSDTLATLYAYEALAYNCVLYGGGATDKSILAANKTIGKLQENFSGRQIYADIGVVLSSESEMTYFTPGGEDTDNNTTIAYMSWCHAFDELNIPYRSVEINSLADEINMYSCLVLPELRSIEQDYIDDVLVPFLDGGGTLIIVGEDSGMYASMDSCMKKNDSCILADLAQTYSGKGKIIYYETNPLTAYIKLQKNADKTTIETLYNKYLADIEDMYNDLISEGRINRLVKFYNLPDSAIATLNYNVTTNMFFCDIANMQYDKTADSMEVASGVKVLLRLPSRLWSKYLKVSVLNADDNKIVELTDYKLDGEYITVELEDFSYYTTIMITEE
ncbi:MAG TPA: hypothetical protein PLT66_04385, partial [Bacillota bacterium]|nr:hypothetical protein [Bacillota bacterium]